MRMCVTVGHALVTMHDVNTFWMSQQMLLSMLLLFTLISLTVNAYIFLFVNRSAYLYIIHALVPLFLAVYPLMTASWVTKQYHWQVPLFVGVVYCLVPVLWAPYFNCHVLGRKNYHYKPFHHQVAKMTNWGNIINNYFEKYDKITTPLETTLEFLSEKWLHCNVLSTGESFEPNTAAQIGSWSWKR